MKPSAPGDWFSQEESLAKYEGKRSGRRRREEEEEEG